jgi:hypothetical protein
VNQQPANRGGLRSRAHALRSAADCQMVDESIDEYALGILDSAPRAAIDRHCATCASCAALIASYQRTAAVLALAAPLASPPASARTALMARIATTPQTTTVPASVYTAGLDTLRTPTLPASAPASSAPAPAGAPSAWWRVYAAPLATLPLLLALGLVAAWGLNSYSQLQHSQNALATRDLQIARLSSQLSNDNNQGVANLVTSPSAKRYTLSPEINGAGDGAQGVLFADPQQNIAALQVSGLPSGSYAVVVQLQNGDMVQKTEFMVGDEGQTTTMVDLGVQVTDLKSVHIRPTATITETDVAIDPQSDVLMTTIGPDISDDSDTSVQKP